MKVGAVVRLGPVAEGSPPGRYTEIRDMAVAMEAADLDSIWLYDHLLYRWPGRPSDGIWECWTVLAALAEVTRRVELGPLVICTPFRNPALLAKMAVTLDEISAGRLTLGVGAGWHQPEFDAFGYPFDHRVSRFEEALRIIRPLLRQGNVDFSGRYHAAPDCEIVPRGPRPNGPPLMLAGRGPRMLHLAARYADSWNAAWHAQPSTAVARLESIRAACEAAGRDPATLDVTVSVGIAYPDLGPCPLPLRDPLVGSPQQVADALHGYDEIGVTHVMVEFAPYTPRSLERFADAVRRFRSA